MQTNLSTFEGLAHRSQLIKERQQVKWINDSKGTNVGATLAAIQGIGSMLTEDHKIVWIAGGVGKGADFSPLSQPVAEHVKCAILLGEDKHKIASVLPPAVPSFFVDSLEEAVVMADKYAQPNDSVLFSPACASFDMFDNYVHRGECFGQLVQEL
jgi:UDP-N-acetylmuramoylalanine--D-glutamate ligase